MPGAFGRHRDDEQGFDRPSKRGSRPRTKQRPEHENAKLGLVTGVDRGRYTLAVPLSAAGVSDSTVFRPPSSSNSAFDGAVLPREENCAEDPQVFGKSEAQVSGPPVSTGLRGPAPTRSHAGVSEERTVLAMKARELRDRIVVGDQVAIVGDTSGTPDTLARIVRLEPRTSVLRRTADDSDPYERIVVANADQLVIVVACANPEPRIGMIDRAVVAAYDAGMSATLVLTKADLAPPDDLVNLYEPAGVRVIVTKPSRTAEGVGLRNWNGMAKATLALDPAALAEVRWALEGKVSVLLGHSGVGKSTLVNALVPGAGRATGAVNDVTGRGRQTSTSAVALRLPDGSGWVIDTPGIRSLGVAHVLTEHVLAAFPDLASVAEEECPRGCTHLESAPDCALDDWAQLDPELELSRSLRLASLRRLLEAREAAATALARHASQQARRSQ